MNKEMMTHLPAAQSALEALHNTAEKIRGGTKVNYRWVATAVRDLAAAHAVHPFDFAGVLPNNPNAVALLVSSGALRSDRFDDFYKVVQTWIDKARSDDFYRKLEHIHLNKVHDVPRERAIRLYRASPDSWNLQLRAPIGLGSGGYRDGKAFIVGTASCSREDLAAVRDAINDLLADET